jgi:hypothetical protein
MKALSLTLFVLLFHQLQSIRIEDATGIKSRSRTNASATSTTTAAFAVSYRLVTRPTLCLNAQSGNLQSHDLIQYFDCSQANNEMFYWDKDLTIRVQAAPSLCLNSQWDLNPGRMLQLYPCSAADNELWIIRADGQIRSLKNPNVCFSGGGSVASGVVIRLATCSSSADQLFFPYPTYAPQGHLVITKNFKCAEVTHPNGPLQAGGQLQLGQCNSAVGIVNQRFYFNDDNTIRATWDTTLCLTAIGGQLNIHDLIQLQPCVTCTGVWCLPNNNQLWNMRSDGTIRSLTKPDMCFNSAGGALVNGEKIQIYPCSAAPNEVFGLMLDGKDEEPYGSIRPNAKPSKCLWSDGSIGSSVTLRPCSPANNSPNQLFIFKNGHLQFSTFPYNNRCLSVSSVFNGAEVKVSACSASTTKFIKLSDGTIHPFTSLEGQLIPSSLCFQTDGGSITSSSHITLVPCTAAASQVFFIVTA